jgi:hypothetical protein
MWEEFAAYDNVDQANTGIVPQSRKFASTLALDWGYDLGAALGLERTFMLATYLSVNSVAKDLTGPINSNQTLLWAGLGRLEGVWSLAPNFQLIGLIGMENWRSDKTYRNTLYNKQNKDSLAFNYAQPLGPDGTPLKDAKGVKIDFNNVLSYEAILNQNRGEQTVLPLVIAAPAPIDYLQMAYGLGFDWDFTQRAGMHVRFKYATHKDKNIPDNDWDGSFLFAETKIWF